METWFGKLMGLEEESPEQVRRNLELRDITLVSKINGESYQFGSLETPTLGELKVRVSTLTFSEKKNRVTQVVGEAKQMHLEKLNNGALFQAASQFNLLEMVGPHVTPEFGVGIYEDDPTQGPACAIACGAGTIYRNYFVSLNGKIGQTKDNQIDCLEDIGVVLNNREQRLWRMENGYALLNQDGLKHINPILKKRNSEFYNKVKNNLRIGIQWNTQVTYNGSDNIVTQVYCSALPVAYSPIDEIYWESFARLILEAAYEATILVGALNYSKNENNQVFLTLVGGGAFGNEEHWILGAIKDATKKYPNLGLDIKIVSYGQINPAIDQMISSI